MGWLSDCIERVKFYADDPSVGGKYTDAQLIKHFIEPAWSQVYNAINMTNDNPVVCRYTFSTVDGQQFYTLPPHIRRIIRLTQYDSNGRVTHDYVPNSEYNPRGPGWQINGNTLEFRPYPTAAVELDLLYIPTADIRVHEATGGTLVDDGAGSPETAIFQFDTTPSLGTLDNRENCYAGTYLQVTNQASPAEVFTYVVESYDASTQRATIRGTLDSTIDSIGLSTDIVYETVPPMGTAMANVIAWRATMSILVVKRASQSTRQSVTSEFVSALKDVRDTFTNLNARSPKRMERDVVDSPDRLGQPLFGTLGS